MNREKQEYTKQPAHDGLLLLCWLGQVVHVQAYKRRIVTCSPGNVTNACRRTWRKALLELLGLVWVVDGESVKIS